MAAGVGPVKKVVELVRTSTSAEEEGPDVGALVPEIGEVGPVVGETAVVEGGATVVAGWLLDLLQAAATPVRHVVARMADAMRSHSGMAHLLISTSGERDERPGTK